MMTPTLAREAADARPPTDAAPDSPWCPREPGPC
jgi:hypothetical protein